LLHFIKQNLNNDFMPIIEKATDEKNMGDNWETILDVCDKVKAITTGPKDCLRAIIKRLYHQNPHVAKQAVIVMHLLN
jgi:signal transducing adaptor molecule